MAPQAIMAKSHGRMQPERLVSDVLFEIMSWLAHYDWLDLTSEDVELLKATTEKDERRPGYSLIRASHVCKYWETVARSNRSLWRYIPLRETATRPYQAIDREFAYRIHRSIGLSSPLHISYTEFPEHETKAHKDWLAMAPHQVSPTSPLYATPVSDWTFTAMRLWPLLVDCIRRSQVLILRAKGSTISDLFGYHEETSPDGIGTFDGRVMLGPYKPLAIGGREKEDNVIKRLEMVKTITKIKEMKNLEELVVNVGDAAFRLSLPMAPNLRKLKIIRTLRQPHFIFPFSSTSFSTPLFSTRQTNLLVSEVQESSSPKLEEISISIPFLNMHSLHHFLVDYTGSLISLTIDISFDIMRPYDSPRHDITFPVLKHLAIRNITTLIHRHVHHWDCPALDELDISIPPKLPTLTYFKTSNYPNLKKLIFRYPEPDYLSINTTGEADLGEQCDASVFLVKLLKNLEGLDSLSVEGWRFRCQWKEVDWVALLTPLRLPVPKPAVRPVWKRPVAIGALSSVRERVRDMFMWQPISQDGHLLDIDGHPLELWADEDLSDELDPEEGEEIERRWREVVEGKVKNSEENSEGDGGYKDGDVWGRIGVKTEYREDKLISAKRDKPIYGGEEEGKEDVLLGSEALQNDAEDDEINEGEWDLNSFIGQKLRHLNFKNCDGLEKTSLFPCIQARATISISPLPVVCEKEVEQLEASTNKEEEEDAEEPPASQSTISTLSRSSSRTSAALSSNCTSPVSLTEELTPKPAPQPLAFEQNTGPKFITSLPIANFTPACYPISISLDDCTLSQAEFDDLYSSYERNKYIVPKARQPPSPELLPHDQRQLWV